MVGFFFFCPPLSAVVQIQPVKCIAARAVNDANWQFTPLDNLLCTLLTPWATALGKQTRKSKVERHKCDAYEMACSKKK